MAVNAALGDAPETINGDAYGAGWMFTVEASDPSQLGALLSSADYAATLDD